MNIFDKPKSEVQTKSQMFKNMKYISIVDYCD